MKQYTEEHVRQIVQSARNEIDLARKHHKSIPRFSAKYETVAAYLESETASGRFKPNSSTGRRIMKAVQENPKYDLATIRGHGKPSGATWTVFDEDGKLPNRISLKNRVEDSKYSRYSNAVGKYRDTGDYTELEKFVGKYYVDNQGVKHKFVTDVELITKLAKVGELPSRNDLYQTTTY